MSYTGEVLVKQDRGGYKRVPIGELDKKQYKRGRKVLWGKRRRFWELKEWSRVTVGWNGVAEKQYQSFTYQEWVEAGDDDAVRDAKDNGRESIKSQVSDFYGKNGYGPGEKWFKDMVGEGFIEFNESVESADEWHEVVTSDAVRDKLWWTSNVFLKGQKVLDDFEADV